MWVSPCLCCHYEEALATDVFVSTQVRKFVIRREVQPKAEGKKSYTKAPRIQRLVTPQRLQHKRHLMALKRRRAEASKDAAVCPYSFNPLGGQKLISCHRTSMPPS